MDPVKEKRLVARKAVGLLDGVEILGLGSGTTVEAFVDELSKTPLASKLVVVPSSTSIERYAKERGLKVVDPGFGRPEITIDGADEVDPDLNLLKGGGGALTREKILAVNSDEYIIIVDHTKLVDRLCSKRPLPIEVLKFAHEWIAEIIETVTRSRVELRKADGGPFITDNGNYILDIHMKPLDDAASLEIQLKMFPGVVEVGLFVGLADMVLAAEGEEVREIRA